MARERPEFPEFFLVQARRAVRLGRDEGYVHDSSDDRLVLWAALQRLPPRQRQVLVLRFYEDLPEAEVARLLHLPLGTAKSLTRRGLENLRRQPALGQPAPDIHGTRGVGTAWMFASRKARETTRTSSGGSGMSCNGPASSARPAHQTAFKRAYRRYRRHRLTLGAVAVAAVGALLVMVVLVPGRVLAGRAPATALPAAHQPTTASPPSSLPFQEPMTLRASPLEGPPGTRIRVSGTGCVATSGTPKLLMTLMRYHPNGSSDSVAFKRFPLRPDGRWSGTLVVPARTPPGSYSSRPIASRAASVPSTGPWSSGSPQLGPELVI